MQKPGDHSATAEGVAREEASWCEAVRASPKSPEGREAFHQLYTRHRGAVLAQALSTVGTPHVAEDLVSEVFTKMLRALSNGAGPTSSVLGYLLVSLRCEVIRVGQIDAPVRTTAPELLSDLFTEAVPDISEGVSERDQILRAFAGVPGDARRVLWLVDVEQLATAEAAEHIGVTPTALRVQLHRARKKLATKFLQQYVEVPRGDCASTARLLAEHVRSNLKRADLARVESHLEVCESCALQERRRRSLQAGLRLVVGPLLIGGGAAGGIALLGGGTSASAVTSVAGAQVAGKSVLLRGAALVAGLAASSALVIAGVVWLLPSGGTAPQPQPSTSGVSVGSEEADGSAGHAAPTPIDDGTVDQRAGQPPRVPGDDATPRWKLVP